jgi:hypothetical protein
MMKKIVISLFLMFTSLYAVLVVDYRMDECYWLNGAGGVIADVKDSSGNGNHATSSSAATIIIAIITPF